MKRLLAVFLILSLLPLGGCKKSAETYQVAVTTKPVYDFTCYLCQDTDISVSLIVTENLSCLHDYSLQVKQMRILEGARTVVVSGAGLESFLQDVLREDLSIIDASASVPLLCGGHQHQEDPHHHHQSDPHIWLSVDNAVIMASNICNGLIAQFPQHRDTLLKNLETLNAKFDQLKAYGTKQLSQLSCRDLITFHDGFSYFAAQWDLHILHAVEEEAGSEASAAKLKHLISLVRDNRIPAVFTEENGSVSAASIVSTETGAGVYTLSMGMTDSDYFETMYHNIDTIKEALG